MIVKVWKPRKKEKKWNLESNNGFVKIINEVCYNENDMRDDRIVSKVYTY